MPKVILSFSEYLYKHSSGRSINQSTLDVAQHYDRLAQTWLGMYVDMRRNAQMHAQTHARKHSHMHARTHACARTHTYTHMHMIHMHMIHNVAT